MFGTMRKPKEGDAGSSKAGRQKFKYVGIPADLYEQVKDFADADDRTVPGIVKRALREYFQRHQPGEGEG